MPEFRRIFLAWKAGSGKLREIVGEINLNEEDACEFKYLPKAQELLIQGFRPYTEFEDLTKIYKHNVIEIFSQRLMNTQRNDIKSFYEFWNIDENRIDDKFYLLGKSQGLSPIDNFEFLAEFSLSENLIFVTELAGLSYLKLSTDTLVIGEELIFQCDPLNENDKYAVKIFNSNNLFCGYVKQIHNKLFYEQGSEMLKIKVKAVEKNGYLKRVFIEISLVNSI